jgi:hypothetical protein
MTEAEWLAGDDPSPMLTLLCGPLDQVTANVALNRKYLLLACACFSRLGELIPPIARRWQERAALAAEGQYDKRTLEAEGEDADWDLLRSWQRADMEGKGRIQALVDLWTWLPEKREDGNDAYYKAERKEQADILRDIIGNPFRSLKLDPRWLSRPIKELAQQIYEELAFDRLPILADALEDAGCTDADILAHCRGPRPHVRGCWVIDLMTGRE